jgi:hypothetical protein
MLGHISPAPVRLTPLAPGGRLPVVCAECSYRHRTPRGPAYPPGVRPRSSRPRHHPAARNRLLLCCAARPHVRNDGWLWVAGIDYQAWAYTVWTFFFSHDTWAWLGFELYLGWEGCGGPIFWMAAAAGRCSAPKSSPSSTSSTSHVGNPRCERSPSLGCRRQDLHVRAQLRLRQGFARLRARDEQGAMLHAVPTEFGLCRRGLGRRPLLVQASVRRRARLHAQCTLQVCLPDCRSTDTPHTAASAEPRVLRIGEAVH